jgi:hypothetical protein
MLHTKECFSVKYKLHVSETREVNKIFASGRIKLNVQFNILHNEKLCDPCRPSDAYRNLGGGGQLILGTPRWRWENNIKMEHRK